MRIDSDNYVIVTVWRLTPFELRIYRQYFAPSEPATAKAEWPV